MNRPLALFLGVLLSSNLSIKAQEPEKPKTPFSAETFSGIKLREIGPAVTSGRVADIAVVPGKPATWYVAVASGGVWKTTDAGANWRKAETFPGVPANTYVSDLEPSPNDEGTV